ncbi:MAG: hypothetical protein ACRERC_14195 [Candidatus Binatia bacterium]
MSDSTMSEFLGIAREAVYSPGKVGADRAILDAVAAQLAGSHRVRVVSADDGLDAARPSGIVFAMCQGPAALATLQKWEAAGVRVVNSVAGILNTHRRRMLAAFERAGIAHPPSRLLATDAPHELPEWVDAGAWLKRGDVHATEPDDVVRVADRADARVALAAMRARGITQALAQRHVDGAVIKFYAVRGHFFAAFPPPECTPALDAGDERRLRALAEAGAAALELEVFGGDCVRDGHRNLWLIDLNDWPSYAPCRFGAGEAIASYLVEKASLQ